MKKWKDKSKRKTVIIVAAIALFFAFVLGNVLRQNSNANNFDPNSQTEVDNTDKAVEEREKPSLESSEEKEAYDKDTKTKKQESSLFTVDLPEDMYVVYDDTNEGLYNISFTDKDQENMFDYIVVPSKEQLDEIVENMVENGGEMFDNVEVKDVKYLGQDAKRINLSSDVVGDVLRFIALELEGENIIISLESYVGSLDYLEQMVNDTLKVK